MGFWNIIGAQALNHVQAFIKNLEKEANGIKAYTRSVMICHGEVPFLYKVSKLTLVPVNKKKERGDYVVVSAFYLILSKQHDTHNITRLNKVHSKTR